jgi:hypothetical protein
MGVGDDSEERETTCASQAAAGRPRGSRLSSLDGVGGEARLTQATQKVGRLVGCWTPAERRLPLLLMHQTQRNDASEVPDDELTHDEACRKVRVIVVDAQQAAAQLLSSRHSSSGLRTATSTVSSGRGDS